MHPCIHPSIRAFVNEFLFAPGVFPRVTLVGVSPVQRGNKHVQHSDATHTAIFLSSTQNAGAEGVHASAN